MFFLVLSTVSTSIIAALGSTTTTVTASSAAVTNGTMISAKCDLSIAAGNADLDALENISW